MSKDSNVNIDSDDNYTMLQQGVTVTEYEISCGLVSLSLKKN